MSNIELITKETADMMDATENAMKSLSDLPNLVKNHFKMLDEVEKSVIRAMEKAESAHDQASCWINAGFGHKKEAIEKLQDIAEGLADSQLSAAEAQKLQFEYQTQLAKITQALFGLGMVSIAANRSVVQEVKMRLKNASEDEINELERNELQKVMLQLQQQYDVMQKQEKLDKKIQKQQTNIEDIYAELQIKNSKDSSQDLAIQSQLKKNLEYDEHFDKNDQKEAAQDAAIDAAIRGQLKKNIEYEQLFEERIQKDNVQDNAINEQLQKNLGYEKALDERKLKDEEQDTVLEELKKKSEECSNLLTTLSDNSKSSNFRLSQLESSAVDFQNNINEQKHFNDFVLDRNQKNEEIISQNHLEILSLIEQIKSLSTSNAEKDSQIEALNIAIDNLKNSVNKKISKIFGAIFAISTTIALILSIINLIT